MPLPASPGQAPPPSPVSGAGPAGTPPMGGAAGATMPVPNRGLQASALSQVQWAVRMLEKALFMIGVGSDVGKDVMKALNTLSKHVPAGSTSPGVDRNALQQMMMQSRQDQPQMALMRALGQGGAAPEAAGAGAQGQQAA